VRASVEGQLKAADPLAAFRAFETSYETERGEAFFDREGRDLRPDEVGR
jgi:hypothetical protein